MPATPEQPLDVDLDVEWLEYTLHRDSDVVAGLILSGDADAISAFCTAVDYDGRLQQWKALKKARKAARR